MFHKERVPQSRMEPAETEKLPNSQKCLITLHIVVWVITNNDHTLLIVEHSKCSKVMYDLWLSIAQEVKI